MPKRLLLSLACLSLLFAAGNTFAATVKDLPPAVYQQLAKLTAADGVATSSFGFSVAISSDGNTIVVGSYNDVLPNNAAYVFVKPSTGWANATAVAELTPSDGIPGNPFGLSVAIGGNNIYVTSRIATLVTDNQYTYGAIYVYTEPTGGWTSGTETVKLTSGSACGCTIGYNIAAGGNSVVATYTGPGSGQAAGLLVWNKPTAGWTKGAPSAILTTTDLNANWDSVAMSSTGKTIVAGNGSLVYLYARPTGGWSGKGVTQTAQLVTSDGDPYDYLGASVAATDTTVVAGAPGRNNDAGAAYVYTMPSGGWVNMQETAQLSSPVGPLLGSSVGISGNTIVAGSPQANANGDYESGAVFVYNKPSGGWKTTSNYATELDATDGNEAAFLGNSLAIGGGTIVAGVPGAAIGSNKQQGAAYVFGQ
jgi:hypothetical protein